MKVSYVELSNKLGKRTEKLFGCSFVKYPMPNIFILTILALLRDKGFKVNYLEGGVNGIGRSQIESFLQPDNSDVYIIYSVNLSMEEDIMIGKILRSCRRSSKLIFLGPAVTYFVENYLFDDSVYAIRGEPEMSILELLEHFRQGKDILSLSGISYLSGAKPKHNPERAIIENLDILPFPARDLVDKNKYYNPKLGAKPYTTMITSRGCVYRCIFCVPCSLNFSRELEYRKQHGQKPPVRMRSVENIAKELNIIAGQGYKALSIIDDQFIWGEERTIAICKEIKKTGLIWDCLARADLINERIAQALAESGCAYVNMGVESFNQNILDYTKKDLLVGKIEETVKLLKKFSIKVKMNILFGASPLETRETLRFTLRKVKELDPDLIMLNICSPFPGTEFYSLAKENKWLKGDYHPVDVASTCEISLPNISAREMEDIIRRANFSFYLNPKFIIRNLKRCRSFSSLKDALVAVIKKLF